MKKTLRLLYFLLILVFNISLLSNDILVVNSRIEIVDLNLSHLSKVQLNDREYTHIKYDELDFWTDNPTGDAQEFASEVLTKGDRKNLPKITHSNILVLSKELGSAKIYSKNKLKSDTYNNFYQWYYSNGSRSKQLALSSYWRIIGEDSTPLRAYGEKIAISSDNTKYIAYRDPNKSSKLVVKKYASEKNIWISIGDKNGISKSSAWYISIVLDSNDIPYVIYKNNSNLIVKKYNEIDNKWDKLSSNNIPMRNGSYLSLSFDKNNIPYIIYSDDTNNKKAVIKKYNSQSNIWESLGNANGISDSQASYTSLHFNSHNIPYAMYTDRGRSSKVIVKKYDSITNKWIHVIQTYYSYKYAQSLTFDSKDNLYIAYSSYGRTFVMKFIPMIGIQTLSNYSISSSKTDNAIIKIDDNDNLYVKYSGGIREYNKNTNRWQYSHPKNILFKNKQKGNFALDSDASVYNFIYDRQKRKNIIKKLSYLDKNLVDFNTAETIADVYNKNSDIILYENNFYQKSTINGQICYKDKYNNHLILNNNLKLKFNGILPENMTCKAMLYKNNSIVVSSRLDVINFGLMNKVKIILNNEIYTHIIKDGAKINFWTNNPDGDGQEFASKIFTKGDRSHLPLVTHNNINVLSNQLGTHKLYTQNGIKSSIDSNFYKWIYTEDENLSSFIDYKNTKYLAYKYNITRSSTLDISMTLNSKNIPYITYREKGYQYSYKANVKKYNSSTNTWEFLGNKDEISKGRAYKTDIAIDKNDVVYIAYADGSKSEKAIVKKYNSSANTWELLGENGISKGQTYSSLSITTDNENIPYIIYQDRGKSGKAIVKKYNSSSNTWELLGEDGISIGYAYDTSIVIDNNNVPYILYKDSKKSYRVIVKKYNVNNNTWNIVGSENISEQSVYKPTIAIDSNNILYITYGDTEKSSKVIVRKYNSNTNIWEFLGNKDGISKGRVYKTDIAIDKNNIPYIVYSDNYNSSKAVLKKYNIDTNTWEQIGENTISRGPVDYLSLDFSTNNIPYIAYKDKWLSSHAIVKTLDIFTKNLVDKIPNGDIIKPEKPVLISNTPSSTLEDSITIEISGEISTEIYINNIKQNKIIPDTGKIEIELNTSGEYEEKQFSITLKDLANNTSEPLIVTIEKIKPIPLIQNNLNNERIIQNTINENTTLAVDINAVDPKNLQLTYFLLSENDFSLFSINAISGLISFKLAPDYENSQDQNSDNIYNITVKVQNSVGGFVLQNVQIEVLNINDNIPIITSSDIFNFEEHLENHTINIQASDLDNDILIYSLNGNEKNDFILNNNIITFKNNPDYELKQQYDLNISISDGNNTIYQIVHINILDDGIKINELLINNINSFTNKNTHTISLVGESNTSIFVNNVNTSILIPQNTMVDIDLNTSGEDGNKIFDIYLKNDLNDKSSIKQIIILKDTVSPTIYMTNPLESDILEDTNITLTFNISDENSGIDINNSTIKYSNNDASYTLKQDENNLSKFDTQNIALEYGHNNIIVTTKDKANNELSKSFGVFVKERKELKAMPIAYANNLVAPATIKFGYDITTDTSIQMYYWDFDGDGVYDRSSLMPEIYNWTYEEAGDFNVTLKVKDLNAKESIGKINIKVLEKDLRSLYPPIPSIGKVPLNVFFYFHKNTWSENLNIEWDFNGDGIYDLNDTKNWLVHTYTEVGDYNVSVRTTNTLGEQKIYNNGKLIISVHDRDVDNAYLSFIRKASNEVILQVDKVIPGDPYSTLDDFNISLIKSFQWDFDGNDIFDEESQENNISHIYYKSGIYYPKVRVNFLNNTFLESNSFIKIDINNTITMTLNNDTIDINNNEFTTITTSYELATDVKIIVENDKFQEVAVIEDWNKKEAGTYTNTWYGKNLKEGKYFIIVLYKDNIIKRIDYKNTTGGEAYVFNDRSLAPLSFAPFDNRPLSISFTLPYAANVISYMGYSYSLNSRMITFRNMQALGKGTYTDKWHSQSDDGLLLKAPPSKYFIYGVRAYNLADNAVYVKSGAHISNVNATPLIYTPDSHDEDGNLLKLQVHFTLTKKANIEFELYNASTGGIVTTRYYPNIEAGEQIIEFDGKDNKDVYLYSGKYTLGIRAIDSNGYKSIMKYTLIRIKY